MLLVWILIVTGATASTIHHTPAQACVKRVNGIISRSFHTPMHIGTMRYDGGLLGVKASVILDKQSQRAMVSLKGAPIGGRITGMAWFQKDGESVGVETDLYHALGRRGVSIVAAGAYKDYSYVWVRIKLPLGMGTHRMILPRTLKTP
tara:strand:- start:4873 stop:5316 length:444 start_codon:yes stop_codon:yes gene_type:complete